MNLEGVSLSQTWAAKGFIKKISDSESLATVVLLSLSLTSPAFLPPSLIKQLSFNCEDSILLYDLYPDRTSVTDSARVNPSQMGKLFIINAPWGFSTAWSVIKSFLDEATAAKISILGSSYQKALLEQVFPESLPAFLGGSCECAEGCATSDAGPWKGEKAMSKVMQRLDSGYGEVGKRV